MRSNIQLRINNFKQELDEDYLYDKRKKLYLTLVSVNILEGIRFYVSFACTFAFGELKLMEGSAKILSLIARDESQHLAITSHIIKNVSNWFDILQNVIIKYTTRDFNYLINFIYGAL